MSAISFNINHTDGQNCQFHSKFLLCNRGTHNFQAELAQQCKTESIENLNHCSMLPSSLISISQAFCGYLLFNWCFSLPFSGVNSVCWSSSLILLHPPVFFPVFLSLDPEREIREKLLCKSEHEPQANHALMKRTEVTPLTCLLVFLQPVFQWN